MRRALRERCRGSPPCPGGLGLCSAILVGVCTRYASGQHIDSFLILTEPQPSDSPGTRYGIAAGIPDTDGDGAGDVVVMASDGRYRPDGSYCSCGTAFVYSGATRLLRYQLWPPALENAQMGVPCGVADLNGDGAGDILIGAWQYGTVFVYSGADGQPLNTITLGAGFGRSVDAVPDLDGDQVTDFVVGNPSAGGSGRGSAYVFSGATRSLLYAVLSPEPLAFANFGQSVAGVPDCDGDGFGDVIVGAPNFQIDEPWQDMRGRAYLFSGATNTLIRTIDSPALPRGQFGLRVTGIPDVDRDGRGDYAVASEQSSEEIGCFSTAANRGVIHVFSGQSGALLYAASTPVCSTRDSFSSFGLASLAGTPDLTGDGAGDLLVGNHSITYPQQPYEAGAAHIVSGRTGAVVRTFLSPAAQPSGYFGISVAAVPNHWRADIVIGATGECTVEPCGPNRRGRAYLIRSCPADFNSDSFVNSQDFFEFLDAFFDQRAAADFAPDGTINSQDFFNFLSVFFAGC